MMLSPMSLSPAPRFQAESLPAVAKRQSVCIECGASYGAATARSEFCSSVCRLAFNNRRLQRGAELYDLVMAWRYQRKIATALHVMRAICRLAQQYREEDAKHRSGRLSWRSPKAIILRRPYLNADRIKAYRRLDQ